jgi:threonylcarbamoyladenosine tRNA methylthiotransferase MtaB
MKVYLDTIGCRLNQAEIEKYSSQFHAHGHEIVASPADADLAIINTCAVTSEAASDSRQKIRQAKRAGCERIIPVGCLSTLEADVLRNLDGVENVVPNSEKDNLVRRILDLDFEGETYESREQVQGSRKRIRAFIKAQDGCDQHCTYCITRIARGKSRSTPLREVVADIHAAEKSGAKEAVLSGVQLGSWGRDLSPARDIAWLVRCIFDETSIPRLRLSSVEPWYLPDDFFSLWNDERLCPQLHLPLQSGSKATLKRMGRINTPESYREIVERIRQVVPGIAITTDIIVGFPGETEEEFQDSLDFMKEMNFAGGHVFHFSAREGTPASRLPGQIEPQVKKERSSRMRTLFAEAGYRYHMDFLGKVLKVLWEQALPNGGESWRLSGLSGNYIRVKTLHTAPLINEISEVLLERQETESVAGRIIV